MNREIVIGFLNEHTKECPYIQLSNNIDNKPCRVCLQINRDISLLIANIKGARKTIDVGLAVLPCENITPYLPYQIAGFRILVQKGQKESVRVKNILYEVYEKGYERVILISNRVPNLPINYIENALERIRNETDVVLGPLENGMFYLIGIKRNYITNILDCIVENDFNFSGTGKQSGFINSIKTANMHPYILPPWYLIRTVNDLKKLHIDFQKGVGWKARWTHEFTRKIV